MSSNQPLLSIIVPHYNGVHHLTPCFEALRAQTYPRLEIIMVDNGSTDESVAFTRQNYPEIKVIALPKNVGFIGAVNHGIGCSRGEIVVPLNNDTAASPQWAEALVERLIAYPDAGMVASKILLFDQRDHFHSAGDGFGTDGIPINRGVWQQDVGQFDHDDYIFGGCGGAVAYRRAMLDEIGLFDPALFMYLEDVDLNWRAQLAGYRAVFAPQAVVYHHVSATGGGAFASYYTGRNTIWVLAKNMPMALLRRHFGKIMRVQLSIAWQALRAWRGEAARARLRGQLVGFMGLPWWLVKRRQVYRAEGVTDDYLAGLLTEAASSG